ncbi:MAG: 4-hydroxy-tetrahydrodipicolinate reductase [Pseudomonadota bacterium]
MLNIALLGASGRMGKAVSSLVGEAADMAVSGRWDEHSGGLAEALVDASVAIDFSHPSCTVELCDALREASVPLVTGTTGLTAQGEAALASLAAVVPVLHDGNMSVAVQLLATLVARAAAALPDYDIEVSESHHRFKVDAPSGTAIKLGAAAAAARDAALDDVAVFDRHGRDSARRNGSIGFAVQRGGNVIGEHTVSLFGQHDRLELRHIADDRRLFADGAVRAARWLVDQSPGKYNVSDMLAEI